MNINSLFRHQLHKYSDVLDGALTSEQTDVVKSFVQQPTFKQAYANQSGEIFLRTQLTIAPIFFSKLTKLKTKFGISCFKEGVNTILKSRYHPVLCVSYLVFVLVFLENLKFGLQFG